MQLRIAHTVPTRVEPSPSVLRVAAMFGLGVDATRTIQVIAPTELDLCARQVVFVTGPSGSGKSTLLRCIAEALTSDAVLRFDDLPALPDRPLVDCFAALSLDDTLKHLSMAGLGDAFVMLRRPSELSDGQRYRLKLAQVMALAEQRSREALTIVLADEFGATLDRITAAVIARNVRKWINRHANLCFIAATTHDDLLEHLEPDMVIEKDFGQAIRIARRD